MSDVRPETPSAQSKQPLALLEDQVQLLSDIREIQKNQQAQLEELKIQNIRLIDLLASQQQVDGAGLDHVKVENFNMPFLSLVGFLIKMTIASIPAAIVVSVLVFAILALLAMLGFGIGGALGGFR